MENIYLTIFLITAVTGVGGLALGGGLAAAVHSPSDRTVSLLLRFTSGVMLSVVCFDLVADALEESGWAGFGRGSWAPISSTAGWTSGLTTATAMPPVSRSMGTIMPTGTKAAICAPADATPSTRRVWSWRRLWPSTTCP